jgi:hypothetical protein
MAAMWSFDQSAIDRDLHLCLAIANDLSLAIGFTTIYWKVILTQLGCQSNSNNLMHIQESNLWYKDKINSMMVVRCTRAFIDHNNVSILTIWHLWTSDHPLNLLLLNLGFRVCVTNPYMHKYEPRITYAMHGAQGAIWCMNRSNLSTFSHKNYFTNLFPRFSIY